MKSITEQLSHDLWRHSRLQKVHLWWPPSCASICSTFSIIYGVLLFDGRPEHGSSSVASFPSRKHKHIFCSRSPSRTPAPTFHVSLLQFSPISSRTCLHLAPLSCNTTSHSEYVQLATVGLHCRSHASMLCRFSSCLWRTMRMRTHMCQIAVEIWYHSPNSLDTPCIVSWQCHS